MRPAICHAHQRGKPNPSLQCLREGFAHSATRPVDRNMPDDLLSAKEAAQRLAIAPATLYSWLGLSDCGLLVIRGQLVTIRYYQGGPSGQGRIRIEPCEVERIKELMRVVPQKAIPRRLQQRCDQFPGITVPLGRPLTSG
jgi:hypothetical protein